MPEYEVHVHSEDDLLPISALQHLLFCERQTALIHVERLWVENRFTAEGRVLHRKADSAKSETRDGKRITRGLPVHSFELGLYGICDVVQFQPPKFTRARRTSLSRQIQQELKRATFNDTEENDVRADETSVTLPEHNGIGGNQPQNSRMFAAKQEATGPLPFAHWTITPVEYKRGKDKTNDCDRVQLCAQAMCLEGMLNVDISSGDLFYGQKMHRTEVQFDQRLRNITCAAAQRLHELMKTKQTPHAIREEKCDTCSLLRVCLPPPPTRMSALEYLRQMTEE